MVKVERVPEPATFDSKCRKPGKAWLAQNSDRQGRPKDIWSPFLGELKQGFRGLCGYAAIIVQEAGTVDHYVSTSSDVSLAYEWTNYRFASGTMNNIKRTKDARVLDPYEVEDGWFRVTLPDCQMVLTDAVPGAVRDKATYTLIAMKLRDDRRLINWRRSWYRQYEGGHLSLEGLRKAAPLIAEAVDRRIASGATR